MAVTVEPSLRVVFVESRSANLAVALTRFVERSIHGFVERIATLFDCLPVIEMYLNVRPPAEVVDHGAESDG